MVGFFRQLWTDISGFFRQLWTDIKGIWGAVTSWFNSAVIQPLVSGFVAAIAAIKNAFDRVWSAVKSGAKSCFNGVIGFIEGAVNGIISGVNRFLSLLSNAAKWASKITGDSWGGIELIPKISLPRFEAGGFPEDGWFRASQGEIMGEFDNGKSVVANNTQIIEGIEGGVERAMMSVMPTIVNAIENSGSNVTIEGDMSKLFRAVIKENNGANKRTFNSNPLYA